MAPILFLFVMQVVMQTLEQFLPSKLEYRFFPNDKGHLLGQRTQSARTPFNLFSLLFIDGAFVFQSRKEIEDADCTINDHFAKFGLQMHFSSSMKTSKTEAMYFPQKLLKSSKINPSLKTSH